MNDGKMVVTEYLEIKRNDKDVIYKATVLNQNQGIGIDFKLTQLFSTRISVILDRLKSG